MNVHKRKLAIIALFVAKSLLISCGSPEPQTTSPARVPTVTPLPRISPPTESLPTSTAAIVRTPIPKQSPTGVTVKEQATASVAPSIVTACAPLAEWVDYTVRFNDTLSFLANGTNITVDQLKQANCLSDDLIFAGQTLRLPFIPSASLTATMTLVPPPPVERSPIATASPTPNIGQPSAPSPIAPSPTPNVEQPTAPTPTQNVEQPSAPSPTPTVEQADAPGPEDPHLTITPPSGPAGTTFTINIDEFVPNEAITIQIVFVDAFKVVFTSSTTVNAAGSAVVKYVSQDSNIAGSYVVEVSGKTSHASGEFSIGN